ncbi:MAG TPA: succinate dehydrogenase, cytochrome b556 subunit [Steroidobacteraceae bacterium]|jgi:succinate dehydrogenase / fumarate reductase cytochrome b subunit
MAERPLSPHVTVYRWAYTMTLSILHRITGLALFLALIGLIVWLTAAAMGAAAYARAMTIIGNPAATPLIALALLALCFHFCNGLRHLAWDMGWGFERAQARRSAVLVIVATVLAAAAALYLLLRAGAA